MRGAFKLQLNVLGLVSIDTLIFDGNTSYLGGGALATAWTASLWEVPTVLYSISCESSCKEVLDRNLLCNKFFSHIILSKDKLMTRFEISIYNEEYKYTISNMSPCHDELCHFLNITTGEQYVKLPADNFAALTDKIDNVSINPQGRFSLLDFAKGTQTKGFIFLNKKELLMAFKQDFQTSLKYIENLQQSFVITLGEDGSICYCAENAKWYFCPSILSVNCVSSLGCGDSFAGGFLAARVKQYSIADCMIYGTISAYLVTLSANNMVTFWLDDILNTSSFEDLKVAIRCFDSNEEVMNFLQTYNCKSVVLKKKPPMSRRFDWILSNGV